MPWTISLSSERIYLSGNLDDQTTVADDLSALEAALEPALEVALTSEIRRTDCEFVPQRIQLAGICVGDEDAQALPSHETIARWRR